MWDVTKGLENKLSNSNPVIKQTVLPPLPQVSLINQTGIKAEVC